MEIKAGHNKKEERGVARRLYIGIGAAVFAALILWGTMLRQGAVPDAPNPPRESMPAPSAQEQVNPVTNDPSRPPESVDSGLPQQQNAQPAAPGQ